MYKKIKYQDQGLAKKLLKRSLSFLLILYFLIIILALVKGLVTISLMTGIVLLILFLFLEGSLLFGLRYLYKNWSQAHTGRFANYLRALEFRELLALLVVSQGLYDEDDGEIVYFPKMAVKFDFKVGRLFLQEPVDGNKYMERFSNGLFDKAVETALLADRETTEFKKNKLISTFAFDPIKFRYKLTSLEPEKGKLQLSKGIIWNYDSAYNGLIAGNVGTGKSFMIFAILGQLLTLTKFVEIIDPKRSDLASLKYIPELKEYVHSTQEEINQAVLTFYDDMMERAKKMEKIKSQGKIGTYKDYNFAPHFLIFDEFGAYNQMNERLSFSDPLKDSYEKAMSCLSEIAMLGRELGFYIIIGMQRPSADSLPMAIRGQLNFRLVMGMPRPEIERMVFPDSDKNLRPLSNELKGWGFVQIGNEQVRSFFAPEVEKGFDLHEYMRKQIAKREKG
ncbi:cell division protein FtsK [Fructobacillus fructosus]|uniref:cell division protein FtsK n=1 Tax=Fructobacillus fructosus TaxID=1631 RepID=UPI002DA3328F|nr:DNA segregation ATPase FtsK/SpoIIIE or related protein (FtsK) [Fructobacillus fructosus]CAK1251475.1 DNA segregation ATPase FtsK/SpoIIIE or related protein (FtsK) [Fructobacillus fructosus]CAK1251699.1 DNA segregation ATPase FtsK/SpoIIIE or related protein (FtsK) [Fructobacillus fructosus]